MNSLVTTPDGTKLVAGDRAGELVVWNLGDGKVLWRASPNQGYVEDLDVSSGGSMIAACSMRFGVHLYDAQDGSVLRTIEVAGTATHSARLFPDGKRLATSHDNGRITIWNIGTGKPLLEIPGNGRPVRIALDAERRRIACSHHDGSVRILDARTGELRTTMSGHSATAYWPTFSPDGKRLVTAGRDASVRFWDTATGAPVLTLTTEPMWLFRTSFSPDGTWLAVSGASHASIFYAPRARE